MSDDLENIDISALMRSYNDNANRSLKELFELKLDEFKVNQSQALEAMKMESRTLNALLTGSSSKVDILSLVKLSNFLEIPQSESVNLYLDSLKKPNDDKSLDIEKRKFILKNFDLGELKKEGILENTSDFEYIENRLINLFNYDSIFDYRKDILNPAYSSAKLFNENRISEYWVDFSRQIFRKINNTNQYDRKALIDYFPTIRWHSMNEEKGLWEVLKSLYKMGITVIYLPKFKKLHVRGSTFAVNKRPCIVLTDYKGFYPTLWFALLHELHHVLFDWDDILINSVHISDSEGMDIYTQTEIEDVANKFARDYLFSEDKMRELSPHINNLFYVKEYTKRHHVHYSIPYVFLAFENHNWGWVKKFMPDINRCLERVKNITLKMSASEIAKYHVNYIYS
ncbi:MAG TPA: ImmA/IrrE family metallo-endopeptidase [Bacteroidia bacterium]|nr:ImmA/IrrE family metallo-endopeptidase [Bacteroidia bacterium]